MRVSNRIVNLLYESSTKDDKIWKLIDKYEAGEMSKEEVEKEVKRLNKGNKAEIEADLALIFKESLTPAEQAEQRPDGSSEYKVRIENRGETVFEEYFSTEEEAIEYARDAVNSTEPGSIIEVLDPTISTVVQVSKKDNEDISYMGRSDAIINMLSDRYTKFNESTGDPAIDNDPDLNPDEVQSEVDYWTDVDNSRTEDVSGREPIGVYTLSNTQAIYVYDIKHDIDDMVLAGDSSDPNTAKWRFINYEDLIDEETGETIPFFYYNAIKVPMNEVMRTNI